MKTTLKVIVILLLLAVGLLGVITINSLKQDAEKAKDIILSGASSPYNYTYTPTAGTAAQLLKTQFGTLGAITITGAGAGYIDFYDATTTKANLRAIAATSSLPTIAQISTSTVVGTYNFDVAFNDGLLIVFTGAIGTSTISWD